MKYTIATRSACSAHHTLSHSRGVMTMFDFSYAHGKLPDKGSRLQAPWERTVFGKPVAVPMTWHHVIPYSLLRDCWNALANHQRTNDRANLALHSVLRILYFEHGSARKILQTMKAGQLPFEMQDTVELALTYAKWNIVEGPAERKDDPRNQLDEFSAGLTPGEQIRHEKLKVLFGSLHKFNEASVGDQAMGDADFDSVARNVELIERSLLGCTRVILFRE
jgi:hypothetical protein